VPGDGVVAETAPLAICFGRSRRPKSGCSIRVNGLSKSVVGAESPSTSGWEAAFWLVFRRTANPIVLLDEHERLLEVNEPGCAMIGLPRGELLGRSLAQRFPPDERAAAARDWQSLLRTGESVGRRILIQPDGSRFEADWAARVTQIGKRSVVIAVLLQGTRRPPADPSGPSVGSLTRREREVVTQIALGLETTEIAARLHVSSETVKSHVRNAMRKLPARTRAQLVAVALSTGQIDDVADLDVPRSGE
jgi:PAS domain S-box-containing protein